ncbi:Acidic amino acid decarboxylase GADL1-like 2 [Homarus americanus]|uniref:Acidic amino acid decarboxylase GADL1-like 2 n=1 Tax=Homarus americanus TaxID=6706 RepID=A0A8J5MJW1_HOMAM|nr:Acidic amino acid decarboxylase GADL1-like 2 [Homarus americanus]
MTPPATTPSAAVKSVSNTTTEASTATSGTTYMNTHHSTPPHPTRMTDRDSTSTSVVDSEGRLLKKVLEVVEREKLVTGMSETQKVVDFHHPQHLQKLLQLEIRREGRTLTEAQEVLEKVVQYSVKTQHPHFYNQLYAGIDEVALTGAWLTEALNTNQHTFEVAPVFIMVEHFVISKLVELFGWQQGDGIFSPGGSMSNMYGLVLARYRAHPEVKRRGNSSTRPLVILTSDQALKEAVKEARRSGGDPFFVNATAGSTVFGAFDPLEEVADVCEEEGLWLHVDACWGGTAILSRTYSHLLQGIHRADSISWNPHKMLGVSLQCSPFIVKHQTLTIHPSPSDSHYPPTTLGLSLPTHHPQTLTIHPSPSDSHYPPTTLRLSLPTHHPQTLTIHPSPSDSHYPPTTLRLSLPTHHPQTLTTHPDSPSDSHYPPVTLTIHPPPSDSHYPPTTLRLSLPTHHPQTLTIHPSPSDSHYPPTTLRLSLPTHHPQGLLHEANSASASYLFQQDKFYDTSYDTGDKSFQCGRKVDAFKLYLVMSLHGLDELERRVDAAFSASRYLYDQVLARPGFRPVLDRCQCTNTCFWYIPPSLRGQPETQEWWEKLSKVAPELKTRMIKAGSMMIGYQPVKEKGLVNFVRMINTCVPAPTNQHMEQVLDQLEALGADL